MTFALDTFIDQCRAALDGENPREAIAGRLRDALASPGDIVAELGEPERAMIDRLYVDDDLTVINVVWAPGMTLLPHNHNMWAVIGVYRGREDNIFWRRIKGDPGGRVEAAGARSIGAGEAVALGRDLIHSVTNPTATCTAAIHVYGGNFFEQPRSEWDPESLDERAYDVARNLELFEAENRIMELRRGLS